MTRTTFALQQHGTHNFYIGRASTSTVNNRVSQIRMGNIDDLLLLSHGELSDVEHDLIIEELRTFNVTRSWYTIPQEHYAISIINELQRFNGDSSNLDRLLRLVKRLQGKPMAEVVYELQGAMNLSRDLVYHYVHVAINAGKLQGTPSVMLT